MQRRLIVMRHAKSDWDTDANSDHGRPLNARGRRDAPRVAQRLVDLGWVPDLVIASDSMRTTETWSRMAGAFDGDVELDLSPALYHGGLGALQVAVGAVPERVRTALVLGHNPGWEQAVAWLTGRDVRMTTGNAALLRVEASSWAQAVARFREWELVEVLRPKEL